MMKELTRARTRRHLLRMAAASAASVPFRCCVLVSATALGWTGWRTRRRRGSGPNCFLRGTRIFRPISELPVEELRHRRRNLYA